MSDALNFYVCIVGVYTSYTSSKTDVVTYDFLFLVRDPRRINSCYIYN